MYHRILVPLDGSQLAEIALTSAFYQAKDSQAEVMLLGVVAPHFASTDLMESAPRIRTAARAVHMSDYLGRQAEKLRSGDLKVSCTTLIGPPAETIIDYAKDNGVDCIIMSSHGQSGSLQWMLGSVADKIARRATMPVLLVKIKA